MADSYQVLKGKYAMALSSIRELEQERDDANTKIQTMNEERAQLDKSTKYLCETILKKEREKEGEVPWFKLPLPQMIDQAQASLENYFPSMQKLYEKLMKINGERTETIADLNIQIDKMKESHKKELSEQAAYKDKIIESLKEKLKTGKLDDEDIEKVVSSVSPSVASGDIEDIDMDASDMSFEEEDTDNMADVIAESATPFHESNEFRAKVKKSPPVKNAPKTKAETKKAVEKAAKIQENEASKAAKKLTDTQKITIRFMGETGASSLPELVHHAEQKFPNDPVKSRMNTGMQALTRKDKCGEGQWPGELVEPVKCSVPGSPNFSLYRLTSLGRDVYTHLFGKEAVEPEMNVILRNHGTLEHGYGIKKIAEMMKEAKYVKKVKAEVIYMTRAKEYTVKTGEKSSYIPDIVLVYTGRNGKEVREYYEYETAKCNESNFFAKCNKMASFTRMINIIVPGKPEKEIVMKELDNWKKSCLEAKEFPFKWERPVEGRVLTYNELKGQSNIEDTRQLDWTRITISRPRKERKS